jgi:hypothetical protein
MRYFSIGLRGFIVFFYRRGRGGEIQEKKEGMFKVFVFPLSNDVHFLKAFPSVFSLR